MPDKGGTFTILATDDPRELAFRVWVDGTRLRPEDIPLVGQEFKTTSEARRHQHLVQYYGEYVFTWAENAELGMWLYYAKNKTPAEANTPYRTYYSTRSHFWPAVLEDLFLVYTRTFPESVVTAVDPGTGFDTVATTPRLFPRFRFRPGVSYNSKVRIDLYQSPRQWEPGSMVSIQPVPTNIDAQYINVNVNFEQCLHPDVVFEEQVPGARILSQTGVLQAPASRKPWRQFFPATNFIDWGVFVFSDQQQFRNGVWGREKVTIYPPPKPEEVLK